MCHTCQFGTNRRFPTARLLALIQLIVDLMCGLMRLLSAVSGGHTAPRTPRSPSRPEIDGVRGGGGGTLIFWPEEQNIVQ